MAARLDFGITDPTSTIGLPPSPALRRMRGLVPETGGFEALSYLAASVWCAENDEPCKEQELPPEALQEFSWQQCFADPAQWWDNKRSKPTPRHPEFRHKKSKVAMWLNNGYKPAWVDSQWDAGMKRPSDSVSTSVERQGLVGRLVVHEDHLELGMCKKLLYEGRRITDAVDALNLLVQRGYHVDKNLFYRVLKRCITHKDLVLGRRIHALTIKSGYEGDEFLATHLIGLYASHGRLEEAMRVFTKVSTPDAYNWATIIFAYARHGEAAQAIRLYRQMHELTTVKPTNHIYVAVLKACTAAGDLIAGKEVHAHILANPGKPDIFVQTGLVNMYANCGSLEDARKVFNRLTERDVVTWTALIAGYAQQGMGQEALNLYYSMQQEGLTPPDCVTFVCLLQACASEGVKALLHGRKLHAQIEERGLQADVVVGNSLVNMYSKCGSLEHARSMFDTLPFRNVVTWNAMLAGYAQQEMGQEALALYSGMRREGISQPNSVTFVCLLQACASLGVGALQQGKQLHAQIDERGLHDDVAVGNSLVNMYAKCGSLDNALSMFHKLPHRNVVTWNAMIAGYAKQGMGKEALSLYSMMEQDSLMPPDSVTFVSLLRACASAGVGALHQGKQLHTLIEKRGLQDDRVLGGSLVNMYAKCGSLEDARSVFQKLPQRDVVTWNAMIAGYAQQEMGQEALSLYSGMQQEGITPNSVTFVCLLQACAIVAALPLGKQLHAQIDEQGLQPDLAVGAALVNMYAKCGSMFDSQRVFDSLPERTIEAWGALTAGYSRQGDSEVVFDLLDRMRLEGIQPDGITFLSVLTVCSHVGLVDKGRKYFAAMTTEHGINPTVEHYTCMMDLLGRAGHLDEALQMAKTVPFPPNVVLWLTLLGACRKWNNVEIGQQAFEFAVSVDAKICSAYVLMSKIYASAEMWEEAKEMQARRVKSGVRKKPGQSWWTDMGGVVHTFVVGDKKHPESQGIYARLEQLVPKMKKEGYVPHLHSSLRDIPDDEKEAELCGHSEKLAIAYALNRTPEGTTIRVVKNLRVCVDCHIATAYISKVEKRTIICRDASRFHVYKEGKCSCGDYW